MTDDVPAGWYPTPDGKQKYWDGLKWTNLPWDGEVASELVENSAAKPKHSKRRRAILIGSGALLVLALVVAGTAWKLSADAEAAEAAEHAASIEKAEKAEKAAEAAERRSAEAERAERVLSVEAVESSVKAMAEGHATDNVIDGPIISASCSPLGGGSTDDLSEKTTVFECFVANKDNGDGTLSGYTYSATMNWTTGEYSYGLGSR